MFGKSENVRYEEALKGKTMQVYFFMLKHYKPLSAREIQRKLGLSSPSLSLHHLAKLQDIGLVTTTSSGFYIINKQVSVGILHFFIGRGWFLIPRFLLYSVFTTSMLITTIYLFGSILTAERILLYMILFILSMILWIETIRIWRRNPF